MQKIKMKRNILFIILFFVVIGCILITNSDKSFKQNLIEKDTKIEDLKRQIDLEEQKSKSLKEKQKYVPFESYIEDIARDELGLIKDNELIIRPNENKSK